MSHMQYVTPIASPADAVRACLEQVSCTLEIASRLLQGGKQVDLLGLDSQIGFVCARVLDLPTEDGKALRPAMVKLLRALDALSAALDAQMPTS